MTRCRGAGDSCSYRVIPVSLVVLGPGIDTHGKCRALQTLTRPSGSKVEIGHCMILRAALQFSRFSSAMKYQYRPANRLSGFEISSIPRFDGLGARDILPRYLVPAFMNRAHATYQHHARIKPTVRSTLDQRSSELHDKPRSGLPHQPRSRHEPTCAVGHHNVVRCACRTTCPPSQF